jgi:hypothetical protein
VKKLWRAIYPSLVFTGLILCSPIIYFLIQTTIFTSKLSVLEEQMRRLPPDDAKLIIAEAKYFAQEHTKDTKSFDYRLDDSSEDDQPKLPASIAKLKPRRISGSEERIQISLMFMIDTGGSLTVLRTENGLWQLEGHFGELEPSFTIFPKSSP